MPKPLLEVGGRPLLWHVISIYAAQGFTRFYPLTGYLSEKIEDFATSTRWPDGVEVQCLDTGPDTPTGERLLRARAVTGEQTFCATYSDGIADIDLDGLLNFHRQQGRTATMTVVRPRLPWGLVGIEPGGEVTGFQEKPLMDSWINGGFFCFEPELYERLTPGSILEQEPLEGLAAAGQLAGFRHQGFWDCVDTYKDLIALNDRWQSGEIPWTLDSNTEVEVH